MQAFLVTVPYLYQLNDKTVPATESQVMYDRNWGYVKRSEPQTLRQNLNFYRCHFTNSIQQAGGKTEREKLELIYNVCMW